VFDSIAQEPHSKVPKIGGRAGALVSRSRAEQSKKKKSAKAAARGAQSACERAPPPGNRDGHELVRFVGGKHV